MMPWIAEADQKELFKDNVTFKTPEEQACSTLQTYVTEAEAKLCSLAVHWSVTLGENLANPFSTVSRWLVVGMWLHRVQERLKQIA